MAFHVRCLSQLTVPLLQEEAVFARTGPLAELQQRVARKQEQFLLQMLRKGHTPIYASRKPEKPKFSFRSLAGMTRRVTFDLIFQPALIAVPSLKDIGKEIGSVDVVTRHQRAASSENIIDAHSVEHISRPEDGNQLQISATRLDLDLHHEPRELGLIRTGDALNDDPWSERHMLTLSLCFDSEVIDEPLTNTRW
jgi:hypothetical protein